MKKLKNILITNNTLVRDEYQDDMKVVYLDSLDFLEVLYAVRDKVHIGYRLLTHPLTGSVKPNETPFKSIIISEKTGPMDFDSLEMIEQAILTAKKFLDQKKIREWPEEVLKDFRTIDHSLISSGIESMKKFS